MPKAQRNLFQVRLSEAEKRQVKTLAASQGLTLQQAVVEAFAAWAQKLQATGPAARVPTAQAGHPKAGGHKPTAENKPVRQAASNARTAPKGWLQQAAKLDWTKCPEVEVMQGKDRRLWVLRGTMAPLAEVLQSVADGHPMKNVAEVFEVELDQLKKVVEFAGAFN